MAAERKIRPGYTVVHPNRERAVCKLTRAFVVLVLLVSVALMLAVTFGGWNKLEGLTPVNFIWSAIYLVMAFFIARWSRGLLPIAAVLGLLLLAFAAIASIGVDSTSWFDRNNATYAGAHAIGGGAGLSASALGTFVLLLIPVELVLAIVAIIGFTQGWNVELEVRDTSDAPGSDAPGSAPLTPGPQPAAT